LTFDIIGVFLKRELVCEVARPAPDPCTQGVRFLNLSSSWQLVFIVVHETPNCLSWNCSHCSLVQRLKIAALLEFEVPDSPGKGKLDQLSRSPKIRASGVPDWGSLLHLGQISDLRRWSLAQSYPNFKMSEHDSDCGERAVIGPGASLVKHPIFHLQAIESMRVNGTLGQTVRKEVCCVASL
jgi:hypothetical protein